MITKRGGTRAEDKKERTRTRKRKNKSKEKNRVLLVDAGWKSDAGRGRCEPSDGPMKEQRKQGRADDGPAPKLRFRKMEKKSESYCWSTSPCDVHDAVPRSSEPIFSLYGERLRGRSARASSLEYGKIFFPFFSTPACESTSLGVYGIFIGAEGIEPHRESVFFLFNRLYFAIFRVHIDFLRFIRSS